MVRLDCIDHVENERRKYMKPLWHTMNMVQYTIPIYLAFAVIVTITLASAQWEHIGRRTVVADIFQWPRHV